MRVLFVPYFHNIAHVSNKFRMVVEDTRGEVLCTGKSQIFYFHYPSKPLGNPPTKRVFCLWLENHQS
jgi:hypothetical protein